MVPSSLIVARSQVQVALSQPRQMGKWDCVTIPAKVMQKALEIDLLEIFQGWYSTQLGFLRLLKKSGFENLPQAIEAASLHAGGIEMTAGDPQDLDLGWSQYRLHDETYDLPVIFLDGMWVGFFHTADGMGNLMTCLTKAKQFWRFECHR